MWNEFHICLGHTSSFFLARIDGVCPSFLFIRFAWFTSFQVSLLLSILTMLCFGFGGSNHLLKLAGDDSPLPETRTVVRSELLYENVTLSSY